MLPWSRVAALPLVRTASHPIKAPSAPTCVLRSSSRPWKRSGFSATSITPLRLAPRSSGRFAVLRTSTQTSLAKNLIRSYTAASNAPPSQDELATVNWILKSGEIKPITEKVGMNLLEMAHKHGIDLEGACEASLACSTCHVIVEDPDVFDKTGDISDEENDMLDLAFGLTATSRLGCQVKLTKELDGMYVRLPSATRNMMVDGHVPKPH